MMDIYVLSGPDTGKAFCFEKDTIFVGRLPDNDIGLNDTTVSSRHLRIRVREGKVFLTDLKSQNGTFFNGTFMSPGIEQEVKKGVPIMIGMSIICIGEECEEHLTSSLTSARPGRPIAGSRVPFAEKRNRTEEKRIELIYKIDDILMDEEIKQALQKVLTRVFELLKRIDRAVIVISNPGTGEIRDVIFKSKRPGEDVTTAYSREVVERVLTEGKPVTISNCRVDMGDEIADTLKIQRIESVMCVPLIGMSKVIGALYADSLDRPHGFRKEDLSLFYDLGRHTALAIEYGSFKSKH